MITLFLIGNTNQYNFANAALAAQLNALDKFGDPLTAVFVLHSPESETALNETKDWEHHLNDHGLDVSIFTYVKVDLSSPDKNKYEIITDHINRFLGYYKDKGEIYIDLTNGKSIYKAIMSNISYVLGVDNQYILESPIRNQFMTPEQLKQAYISLPNPDLLDPIASTWLTQVRRFKKTSEELADTYKNICGTGESQTEGFKFDIQNAIDSWFKGEKHVDGSSLGGSVRYNGRAFEDLISGIYFRIFGNKVNRPTLYKMLHLICQHISDIAPKYEPELLIKISQLLRTHRNDSAHGQTSAEFGKIRARISTELLIATLEYLEIICDNIDLTHKQVEITKCQTTPKKGIEYFFGIDGDNTGSELEFLFQSSSSEENLKNFSKSIDTAIKAIINIVKSEPIHGNIIFASGDDILFKGTYDRKTLDKIQTVYYEKSGGHTCSIGFGPTLKSVYLALKLAKSTPGKNTVKGLMFTED